MFIYTENTPNPINAFKITTYSTKRTKHTWIHFKNIYFQKKSKYWIVFYFIIYQISIIHILYILYCLYMLYILYIFLFCKFRIFVYLFVDVVYFVYFFYILYPFPARSRGDVDEAVTASAFYDNSDVAVISATDLSCYGPTVTLWNHSPNPRHGAPA